MTVPFKVKAIYEYKSDEPDDLKFGNGQVITVTEDDDADWFTGEYISADGEKHDGIFPRNFVEKYEPAIPSRPVRTVKKTPAPGPAPAPESRVESEASTSVPETKEPTPAAALPPPIDIHEPSRQAEIANSAPVLKAEDPLPTVAPAVESKPPPSAKKPPPVAEKPSSNAFKDRIAAFNKAAAGPIAPFKPGGAGAGSFIKKPFVAPPPSRNAYVPPPREQAPPKVFRREEQMENERQEPVPERPPPISERQPTDQDDDQPKFETLKERMARLQQQQLENAQRQTDTTKRKEKPKRPTKPRTESSEDPVDSTDNGTQLERVSTEKSKREPTVAEDETILRRSTEESSAPTPPLPSRELVSDTNDADDSGAADTEDALDISTEEEHPRPKSVKPTPLIAKQETTAEVEEEEEETEEEEDPEMRRKRELRERMARLGGGMGMMNMFGAPAPAPAPIPRKVKPSREERPHEAQADEDEDVVRSPPVPIMALPGMSNVRQTPKPSQLDSDNEQDYVQPTPPAAQHAETAHDDYISQTLSRRSTARSTQERAPPSPLDDHPRPPQSPGARPIPPPPPPTQREDLPLATELAHENDEDEDVKPTSPSASQSPTFSTAPAPRAVPPPLPLAESSANVPRAIPPVPMSPTLPQSRPPPPPPPGQPPSRRPTDESSLQTPVHADSEDEVTEYDGDYDTDIASSAKHKAALKSHNRDSSLDEGALSDDAAGEPASPPPRALPPPIPTAAPRDIPPPPPTSSRPTESVDAPRAAPPPVPPPQARDLPPPPPQTAPRPRESVDYPRAPPPPVPAPKSPIDEDDYDPYRYNSTQPIALPNMVASMRKTTEDFDKEFEEYLSPPGNPAPPLPPFQRSIPPPVTNEDEPIIMSGALSAPKRSTDLARSNTTTRGSVDVPRPGNDQGFIAADIDLGQGSMWWTQDNNPPPALQNRSDVLWEIETNTSQKRGGRSSIVRDVYILYQDYSQSTINATYDASEPSHVSFEQNHERPPIPPRKDQLESASESFGVNIAKAAEKALGSTVGEGNAHEFVSSLIRSIHTALLPVGTRSYGALVYANLANASTQQFDEIRPGDIITFRNAKFSGHKGGLHQKYSQDVGTHVGVVADWDGTKKKIRAWEQGSNEKGKKSKVREESYRVADLKSGEVRVWRVMPRSYVNWGTA